MFHALAKHCTHLPSLPPVAKSLRLHKVQTVQDISIIYFLSSLF